MTEHTFFHTPCNFFCWHFKSREKQKILNFHPLTCATVLNTEPQTHATLCKMQPQCGSGSAFSVFTQGRKLVALISKQMKGQLCYIVLKFRKVFYSNGIFLVRKSYGIYYPNISIPNKKWEGEQFTEIQKKGVIEGESSVHLTFSINRKMTCCQ